MVVMQSKAPDSACSQAAGNWDFNFGLRQTYCAHFLTACEAVSSISIGHFCSGIRSRST